MKNKRRNSIISFLKNYLAAIYAAGFLILICLLLGLLGFEGLSGLTLKKIELGENRRMAGFPVISEIDPIRLPQKIEAYFSDNLPLRTQIIYKYRKLWKNCGVVSSMPVRGKDGHEFLNLDFIKTLNKDVELPVLYRIRTYIAGKKVFWDLNGAEYHTYIIPMKENLYSEFLPVWASDVKSHALQVEEFINSTGNDSIYLENLSPLLESNKDEVPLYNKVENVSHWNGNALGIVYKYLCEQLADNSNFTSVPAAGAFSIENRKANGGMLGDGEVIPWMVLNTDGLKNIDAEYPYTKPSLIKWDSCDIIINDDIARGTLLLVTDSYFKATHQNHLQGSNGNIFPLAKNVHKYIHTHYSKNTTKLLETLVSDHRPDIVIECFVERLIPDFGKVTQENREFFVAGEMELADVQLFVSKDSLVEKDRVSVGSNECRVKFENRGDKIGIGSIMPNSDGRVCVMARINSSSDGKVLLYYKQSGNKYKAYDVLEQDIVEGDNYLYMPVYGSPGDEFEFAIGFDGENVEYTFYPQPSIQEIFDVNNKAEEK